MSATPSLRTAGPELARIFTRFAPLLRRQRALLVGGTAGLLGQVVFRLLEPWPLKVVIDTVAAPAGAAGAAPPAGAEGTVVVAAVALVVIVGLRAGASYASTVALALAGNRILTEVRSSLFAHVQQLSMSFHHRTRAGDMVNRLTGDVGRLQEVMVTAALPLAGNVITFVGMFGVMVWLDWQLAFVALVALPLFLLTNVRLSRRITSVSRKQRAQEGELASTASEALNAMLVVQAYSLEPTLQDSFGSANQKNLRDGVKAKKLSARLERSTDLFIAAATGLVLAFGARRVLTGQITPGELVVFLSYLKSAFKPMRDLAKYTGRLAKAAASGERILDVLDTEPDIGDRSWARPAPPFVGHVTFEDVVVEYAPGARVLDGVHLEVLAGERVGVVGASGAGKSSLAALLLRLYEPTRGRVLVDGHDLRDLTIASVRPQVAIVLQESVLFATTIRENIAYGARDTGRVSDEEIVAAARLANAHDFITALPDGYDTVLGERGSTLSGGERQRIAIARAAIADAPILVLDEATTGLDHRNVAEVLDALRRLSEGRTTFIISHDDAAVEGVDLLVRIEDRRLVEVTRRPRRRGTDHEDQEVPTGAEPR